MGRVKAWVWTVLILAVLFFVWVWFFAGPKPTVAKTSLKEVPKIVYSDHTEAFAEAGITSYEGAKSCVDCHEDETRDVFHSYHYQMQNLVSDVEGHTPAMAGGKLAYNDFCGAIFWDGKVNVNYIGKALLKAPPPEFENLMGSFIASGCSMCHGVSMGGIPQPAEEPSEEQLGNIDCLACHADPEVLPTGGKGVKAGIKVPVKGEDGQWRYVYNPELGIEKIASHIVAEPTKDQCLLCHAFSGGGPGFKRPNLEPALMGEVHEDLDVHLARGMECTDCHVFKKHEVALEGPDSWARTDRVDAPDCADCHEERHTKPVIGWVLETFHMEKVACQTCHIPHYAKEAPTDTHRDWSKAEFSEKLKRWEPEIELAQNLKPTYRWWNEKSRVAYLYPEPAKVEDGTITYAAPVAEEAKRAGLLKFTTDGKIYPFKRHEAIVPFDTQRQIPIPVKVGLVFAAGDTQKAAQVGAKLAGLNFSGEYVTLERLMAINHGVEPAENALQCFDCHGPVLRNMPWHELGYGKYPEVVFSIFLLLGLVVGVALLYWLIRK
ncbi:MAG TPA: hypothetical protein ENK37_08510 [Oceanithermus profundus]|uniref:Cytochrome c7-like domain-containing protein n=1 Tax=Oceanithermus profundus TaxID=187137 RepID=A0A7C4Z5X9_9DEIN|nr:hypothetical protein [Oceanithermus profundus]